MLPASVHQSASRLSRSGKVRAALARRRELAASRAAVTEDRVLAELARIGFADLSNYGELLQGAELDDLPPGAAAALSEVTVDTYADGRGAGAREVRRVRIKLHPKLAALEQLSKHLGLFAAELDDGYGIPDTRPVSELTIGELRAGIELLREPLRPGSAGQLGDPGAGGAAELRIGEDQVELDPAAGTESVDRRSAD